MAAIGMKETFLGVGESGLGGLTDATPLRFSVNVAI